MNIVIVGDGKVGYTLTEHLSKEGHDVTVIDNRPESLAQSMNAQDVFCVEGNGVNYSVQIEAGVPKADLLIAATSRDEINMLCCMVAKKLGAKHTIARVRDPEYQKQMLFLKEELGLSMTVNPEMAAAVDISRMLRFSAAINVDSFAKGRVEIVEFKVKDGSPLIGLTLMELNRKFQTRVLVCVVSRDDQPHIPRGDFIIQEGDRLNVVAAPHDISAFFRATGMLQRRAKSIMIVGGGRIAHYLASQLLDSGIQVKIIERDEARCHALSELFPKAEILHGDGTDQELLHEEGLHTVDAFISLTGIDEENIILSMYAQSCKVDKVITKVNNGRFINMLNGSGLEGFISPKSVATQRILSYVRAMQNASGSNVETLYPLADGHVEALEFRVRAGSLCAGVPLKDLSIRKNVLIGAIIRRGKCIIPGGEDMIEPGDSVIIVTTLQGLQEMDTILEDI
ncbi:MAG: Trk system potassium transporter TrkA [Clostridia bacterium]|nr:Trk system potassium transporter TrkA [Clostridia bacterium]